MTNNEHNKKNKLSKFRNDAFLKQAQKAFTGIEPQLKKAAELFSAFNQKPIQEMMKVMESLTKPIADFNKQQNEVAETFMKSIESINFKIPEGMYIDIPKFKEESIHEYIIHQQNPDLYISYETKKEIAEIAAKKIIEALSVKTEQGTQKQANAKKYGFPNHFKWEDISIKFLDGHTVKIKIGKFFNLKSDYKEMGFEDKRKFKPNQQWTLLKILSDKDGEINWEDKRANNTIKKKKQLLSEGLRNFFEIKDDPFFPYKKFKAYKIKIILVTEGNQL